MSKRQRETEAATDDSPKAKRPTPGLAVNVPAPAQAAYAAAAALGREFELPTGWLECPDFGHTIPNLRLVPVKVPLGRKFDRVIPEHQRFTPAHVLSRLREWHIEVGLVIDLTNTTRYYQYDEWQGIPHLKITCRGKGEAPDAEAVNAFCWQMMVFRQRHNQAPNVHVVVHCTHGFNRTGFMIANYMVRCGASTVQAVKSFAQSRPPGIYKHEYLERLFTYNHEHRPSSLRTPPLPDWKANAPPSPQANGPAAAEEPAGAPPEEPARKIAHDDQIGEPISDDEAQEVQKIILQGILNPNNDREIDRIYFPGSQPVSLARENLSLLAQRHYWVTWKADGTRYMLLACPWGTYLVDRSFNVRRFQMRFPTRYHPEQGRSAPASVVGPPHLNTLLDGEMVVDEDKATGARKRRFLAYDLMMLNNTSLVHKPFKERFQLMEKEVMGPRARERDVIARDPKYPLRYDYGAEDFGVRRKDFWPLAQARKVLADLIPHQLLHEADGLILQGWEDEYVPGTCEELLKYKFPHLNSVDFLLRLEGRVWQLCLLETRRNAPRPKGLQPLPDAYVIFDNNEDIEEYNGKIIECTWLAEEGAWKFLRARSDKDRPNAYHVFESVMRSIDDNITDKVILEHIAEAVKAPQYAKDTVQHR